MDSSSDGYSLFSSFSTDTLMEKKRFWTSTKILVAIILLTIGICSAAVLISVNYRESSRISSFGSGECGQPKVVSTTWWFQKVEFDVFAAFQPPKDKKYIRDVVVTFYSPTGVKLGRSTLSRQITSEEQRRVPLYTKTLRLTSFFFRKMPMAFYLDATYSWMASDSTMGPWLAIETKVPYRVQCFLPYDSSSDLEYFD